MQARFHQVLGNPLTIVGISCMLALVIFHEPTSMYYYLTIAQLVFVPVIVQQIVTLGRWQKIAILLGQFAVTSLYFIDHDLVAWFASGVYCVSTVAISWSGVQRFLQRGFTNVGEMMIDIGLLYIVMGGGWFFAHINDINTGFSPIITWLTAIHFHYSACLLCITVGLLGRVFTSRYFTICAAVIASGPMLVAVGITFSRIIEIVSVSLYVIAVFSLTVYTFRIRLRHSATVFIRIAFLTLSFTIVWSFLYAYSNLTGTGLVDIPDMLAFHGFLNCLFFGGVVTIAWSIYVPASLHQPYTFPTSQIRGKGFKKLHLHHALVDDMSCLIDKERLPFHVVDFYENTLQYGLTASVKWSRWFKPFAFLYQIISKKMEQLNLPFSPEPIVMEGTIMKVDEEVDGRTDPRVWQRHANGRTIFSAIYAIHKDSHRAYMNIALPLPKSAMHGILAANVKDHKLYLTSDANGDSGTYFSVGRYTFKLPLHEYFTIWEEDGEIQATHSMTIFGVNFLHIDYSMQKVKQ